ncbi:ERF superfamily protein [compost metagenome]
METEIKGVYPKLLAIQKKINGLAKDAKANGYGYVTGSKVLEFIKPLMNEYGLILKQEVLNIENVRQDYSTKAGLRSEILSKLEMRFTWIDAETNEKDENLFGANGQNGWDKGVGSALTYAERYFLLKYFHIATDEDDIDNPHRKPDESSDSTNKEVVNNENKAIVKVPLQPLLSSNKELWDKTVTWVLEKNCQNRLKKVKESYIITDADLKIIDDMVVDALFSQEREKNIQSQKSLMPN